MALPLKIKIRWGYLIAFLTLIVSYFLVFLILSQLTKETGDVNHSFTIINKLETIKAEITDAETGVRGYMITKEVRFLQPYNSGSRNSKALNTELYRLNGSKTGDTLMNALGSLIDRRLARFAITIENFQRAGNTITDEMRSNRERTKSIMDSIRIVVKQLQQREYVVMDKRSAKLARSFTTTEVIAVTSLVVVLVSVIFSLLVYTRENRAKELADEQTKAYRGELEQRVSELDKVNTELQELKSIEKFASTGRIARTIAHEVRNPLTNISLASEQLKDAISKTPETDLLLDMIGRNATRINQLVSDLLNSTRFAQLVYTDTDINVLLDEALDQAKDRIELNHIRVEKKYDTHISPVKLDREKIKLAFLNIIVNAIEAMEKDKGILQISTRLLGNRYVVEFRDNGIGLDDEALQKLFEPYFTSKMKGNGLGLTNTQNIILNHKGNIKVRSKPGSGAVFQIFLPLDGTDRQDG